jgi:sec-independent protein translocase protein TatB
MFGLDPIEVLIIAGVALFAFGPAELPRAMTIAARWIGRGRGMARELQGHVETFMREAEVEVLQDRMRGTLTVGSQIPAPADRMPEIGGALAACENESSSSLNCAPEQPRVNHGA